MEETTENLLVRHQQVAAKKVSDIHSDYMEQVRNFWKYGLMWNKVGVTIAENNLNALISGYSRWSDAGMLYQRTLMKAFGPHEARKIDRMVHEIVKST